MSKMQKNNRTERVKMGEMAMVELDKHIIVVRTAGLANEIGFDNINLNVIADAFGVQTSFLYKYVQGLDDLKKSLMLYGWKQLEAQLLMAIVGLRGYDALRAMCYAFYEYATGNLGVFNVMLWYNKFQDEETLDATKHLFSVVFKIMETLNVPEETINHLIRTFRGFLEGYVLLVNNGAFGNPLSVRESFNLSVEVFLAGIEKVVQN